MYECHNCNRQFEEPKIAYSPTIHGNSVITEDSPRFDEFEAVHSDHWLYCPHCGSDDITDLDDKVLTPTPKI